MEGGRRGGGGEGGLGLAVGVLRIHEAGERSLTGRALNLTLILIKKSEEFYSLLVVDLVSTIHIADKDEYDLRLSPTCCRYRAILLTYMLQKVVTRLGVELCRLHRPVVVKKGLDNVDFVKRLMCNNLTQNVVGIGHHHSAYSDPSIRDQIRDEVQQEVWGQMQQELLEQRREQKLEMEEVMKRFMSKQPQQSSHTLMLMTDDATS
ncbi:hypothetical protein SASPL_134514 [Salvia splendens]|uniref:Uncharacterized protein n=1 Tax=Salvia splendens TaxID=180675 RepID=A0A8X8X518_SALSN|nr:hypothetical protein SASPL_134514 [Salvia splendens]